MTYTAAADAIENGFDHVASAFVEARIEGRQVLQGLLSSAVENPLAFIEHTSGELSGLPTVEDDLAAVESATLKLFSIDIDGLVIECLAYVLHGDSSETVGMEDRGRIIAHRGSGTPDNMPANDDLITLSRNYLLT